MCDPDVFAILTAKDKKNKASSAFKLSHNARWFRPAHEGVALEDTIDSREPTPAPVDKEAEEEQSIVDQLILTFSELMLLQNIGDGIQAGTSKAKSHILLGHRGTRGISACQFRITVAAATDDENDKDHNLSIWLHDYHSTHGTAVGYDKRNQHETRVKETWILAYGPGTPNRFRRHITINAGGLIISIEFPNHEQPDKRYEENLRALVEKAKKDKGILDVQGLGLESQTATQPPSESQTTSNRLVYYKENKIGSGSYATVYKLIRARDGKAFAAKIFTAPMTSALKRFRDEIDPQWLTNIRREYTIVKDNPHPNILHVLEMRETLPEISIIMRYYAEGNAVGLKMCEEKSISAIGQIIDCLTFLHDRGIMHRDIKPENVLIESRPYFKVVLSDFGFSRIITPSKWAHSFLGTLAYIAPEVFPTNEYAYGTYADVWSVGIMALEWLYGLPPLQPIPQLVDVSPKRWLPWIEVRVNKLMERLNDQEPGVDINLLNGMLDSSTRQRLTAKQALNKGIKDGLFQRRAMDGLIECGKATGDISDLASKETLTHIPKMNFQDDSEATIIHGRLESASRQK